MDKHKIKLATALAALMALLLAACGGESGGSGGTSTGAPAPNNVPHFAYVANAADNSISIYTVNAATGQLRANGYAMAGSGPISIAVDPAGRFAYTANWGFMGSGATVSAYAINAGNGALTPINCGGGAGCTGADFTAGTSPRFVTVDPSGKFVYVLNNNSNDISAYSINSSTGALVLVGTFAAGTSPSAARVDPAGKFLYVANAGAANAGTVSAYAINAATGALTRISCGAVGTAGCSGAATPTDFAAGGGSFSIAIDPTGRFVYVANLASDNITAYRINGTTGALTQIVCSIGVNCAGANFIAGKSPQSIAIDSSGKFAYAANNGSNDVSAYAIDTATGALAQVSCGAAGTPGCSGAAAPTRFAAGAGPFSVTVDPSGKYAYVPNSGGDNSSIYRIDAASGALTPLGTMATRKVPTSIAMTNSTTPVSYTPKFAYVANFSSNNVSAYTINTATGALTSVGAAVAAGAAPLSVTVDPSGKFAYVANQNSNDVSAYTINATTGVLTSAGATVAAGASPSSVVVDPSGRFAYVANGLSNDVSAYAINTTTGVLTSVGATVAAGTRPYSVSVDPSGRFVYVANQNSNDVSAYTINATTGVLTSAGATVAAGTSPVSVTVDPFGKFAYVANILSNTVSAYAINATTGALTSVGATVGAGTKPYSVRVDPSGRFAYVANRGSSDVAAYAIDATTGALTVGATVPAGFGSFSVTTTGTIQ